MTTLSEHIGAFLRWRYEESPVTASALGLTDYDERLDDLSAASIERHDAEAAEWLGRFESVPDDGLSPDERIDRDLAIAVLRGRVVLADWLEWRRDPLEYSDPVVRGIFGLFLHRLRPDRDLVDAAVARLEQASRALDQGRANLDPSLAHPLIVERATGSARGGARYFRELLATSVPAGADRDRLAAAGATAADALDAWAADLEELGRRAHGTWQLGEERYTRLLRERESLRFDARELREMGRREYDRTAAEMREVALAARGTDDYAAVLEEAEADHPATEEERRAASAEWTERARAFLVDTGLVTLPPGERCVVDPSPVFQRPVLGVASYMSPPAFADTMLGHFFVPFAPDGAGPDEIEKRLRSNSHGHVPTTSVHEAYPGHHWHLVMRKQHPSAIRRVFGTPYFTEGWGLYAERVMRERGFYTDPIHELFHLNATLFRAARIIVDTSLHLGEMTFDEAVAFMVGNAALSEPTARAEVGRYCSWPTQASSYLTGCLEILRIRDAWLAARGLGSTPPAQAPVEVLRAFHDAIARSGALPLGLAERAVLGEPGTEE